MSRRLSELLPVRAGPAQAKIEEIPARRLDPSGFGKRGIEIAAIHVCGPLFELRCSDTHRDDGVGTRIDADHVVLLLRATIGGAQEVGFRRGSGALDFGRLAQPLLTGVETGNDGRDRGLQCRPRHLG